MRPTIRTLIILISALVFCSCGDGVSEKDKEKAQMELESCLDDMYAYSAKMPVMFLHVNILDIKKSDSGLMHADYIATFSCNFERKDDNVHLTGQCGFDKNFRVTHYDDVMGINIFTVTINGKVSRDKDNPYILKNMDNYWAPKAK